MPMPVQFVREDVIEVFDDFFKLDTAATNGQWLSTNDGGTGTLALVTTAVGGKINIPSAAADNDYQLLSTPVKCFQFAAGKPLWAEIILTHTEAATNAANFVFGLSSVIATGFMADNGAGPPATFDGFVFYKVDGSLLWKTMASVGTTQSTSGTLVTGVSGTIYRFGFTFDPGDGTTGIITPEVNGQPIYTTGPNPFTHKIALASAGLMYPIFGVKAGSGSAETLTVDRVRIVQVR